MVFYLNLEMERYLDILFSGFQAFRWTVIYLEMERIFYFQVFRFPGRLCNLNL